MDDRDKLFNSIIQQSSWIIEDIGRPCFEEGLKEADTIVLLEVSKNIRKYRILRRWFRQRLGIEKCIYKPRFKMLRCMYIWSNDYETGKDNLKERLIPFQKKLIILRNNKDIYSFEKLITN